MYGTSVSLIVAMASVSMWLAAVPACASGEETVVEFANRLREIIASGNSKAFRQIACYPSSCIDEEDVRFVFGTVEDKSYIRRLLSDPRTEVKIFGPYTYSDDLKDRSFAIMFYNPGVVRFDAKGELSEEQRTDLWWNGYVETVVSPVGSGWGFHRTPFYHGADPPWSDDF